jgi:citrate synthase
MKFKTNISKTERGKHTVRGYDMLELIQKHSFSETLFLLLRGNFPQEKERQLAEAMLVAAMENGIESPSLYVPRIVAASGNEFHIALAAGMIAIGERHGGAAEKAAELLCSEKSSQDIVREYTIVPGFGHKVYKEEDPRAKTLYVMAQELGFPCKYFEKAYAVEKELAAKKGKKLPLNIDGAIACCMLELGFDARLGKAFFLISRIVGMSAHILEEMNQKNSYYRLEEGDVEHEE